MQEAYFIEHKTYALDGITASAAAPLAYLIIGIEIMPSARYSYTVNMPNPDQFTCVAIANLDDDATVDTWTINQTGTLVNTINDSVL